MRIIFATSNKAKFKMAKQIIHNKAITLVYKNFKFEEPKDVDVIPIVKSKAIQAWKKFKRPLIVNDSGIFIEALSGFPGTQVKFALQTIGLKNILKLTKGCKNRNMSFRYAVAYVDNKKMKIFHGEYLGKITDVLSDGNMRGWSDFIRIYIPKGFDKTPAEMSEEEFKQFHENFKKINPFYKFLKWTKDLK